MPNIYHLRYTIRFCFNVLISLTYLHFSYAHRQCFWSFPCFYSLVVIQAKTIFSSVNHVQTYLNETSQTTHYNAFSGIFSNGSENCFLIVKYCTKILVFQNLALSCFCQFLLQKALTVCNIFEKSTPFLSTKFYYLGRKDAPQNSIP